MKLAKPTEIYIFCLFIYLVVLNCESHSYNNCEYLVLY